MILSLQTREKAPYIVIVGTEEMLSKPELIRASIQALASGGCLQHTSEPAVLNDPDMVRGADGNALRHGPDVSQWFAMPFRSKNLRPFRFEERLPPDICGSPLGGRAALGISVSDFRTRRP